MKPWSLQRSVRSLDGVKRGGNVGLSGPFISSDDVQMIWKEDFWQLNWIFAPEGSAISDKTNDRMNERVLIAAVRLC